MGCSPLKRGCGRSFFFSAIQPGDKFPKMTAGPFREPFGSRPLPSNCSTSAWCSLDCALRTNLPYLAFFWPSMHASGTATGEYWLADGLLSQLS